MSEPIIIDMKKKENKDSNSDSFNNNFDVDKDCERSVDFSAEDRVHDFPSMFINLFNSIPWKTSIYLFILMIIIFSRQFIENVLSSIGGNNWVEADQPTNQGTIVLCIITVIGYILIDLLVKSSIL